MKYFITGGTGYIGSEIIKQLLLDGETVHVLVRSPEKNPQKEDPKLRTFKGEINDYNAIERAMAECDFVFHLASYVQPWSKNKNLPYLINVEGTRNVLKAALKNNIKRVVFTSTVGVYRSSFTDELVDETSAMPDAYLTDYETTKLAAEKLCLDYFAKGLDVVIVNPSRVFGPGLLSKGNSLTTVINKYIDGKWRIIPGNGKAIGNYIFIDDVVSGHILALKHGKSGERYIIGGTDSDFIGFFKTLADVSNVNYKLHKLPLWVMLLASYTMLLVAKVFNVPPLITPGFVKRYNQSRRLSCNKAVRELGYTITPLNEGIQKTIEWLRKKPE